MVAQVVAGHWLNSRMKESDHLFPQVRAVENSTTRCSRSAAAVELGNLQHHEENPRFVADGYGQKTSSPTP